MAGEYDINLSNGTILATLYPLEVNGPDNLSTPRQIQVTNATANEFEIVGDMTGRFVAGFQFTVQNSGGSDGTYTVAAGGSTYSVGTERTTIPVTVSVPSESLPLGEIQYTVLDARTTLQLPGRGTVNWGEYFVDNFVHALENFAADDPPNTNTNIGTVPFGQPLRGQQWYNTTTGQEGFKYFDGSVWTSNLDIDNGALIFRDSEDGNKDIYLAGSESEIPLLPWSGSPALPGQPGFVVWQESDPSSGEANFRVLSSDGTEELRIEYDGRVETNGALYVKNQSSYGAGNIIDGDLGIGGGTFDGSIINTLTVEGNGIYVAADLTQNAEMNLDAPEGMNANINFLYTSVGSPVTDVQLGDISVQATAGSALTINSTTANDVVLASGGGNVGINETIPSAQLDVVGTTELNGTLTVVAADVIFDIDTLYVDATNDRVGINKVPVASFDVTGVDTSMLMTGNITITSTNGDIEINANNGNTITIDAASDPNGSIAIQAGATGALELEGHPILITGDTEFYEPVLFDSPIGINNAPPSGAPVWLEVTGDIQVNSQFRGSVQSAASPTYSFAGDLDTGMYNAGANLLGFAAGGTNILTLTSSAIVTTAEIQAVTYTFDGDTDTSITRSAPDEMILKTNGLTRLILKSDGTLVAGTTNYETLVTLDDVIPNKKYVDDAITNDAIQEVVEDISPQLGGNLDVNGFSIVTSGSPGDDIVLDPTGTGDVAVNSSLVVTDDVVLTGTPGVTGIRHQSAAGPLWTTGTGSPEGVVDAPVGSLYTRTDGGAGTTLYVKESAGLGSPIDTTTGWVAK